MTSIGNFAFHNCIALTSITIPNSVTNIYAYAFYDCTNLNKVTIEVNKNLEIGNCAFYDCGVEMLIMNGETLLKSVDDDFISAFNTTSLYVPSSLYEEYRSTSPWNKFVNIKIIDDENTGISKSELEQPCNSTIYDVNGRKVVESTLKPGLYIRNGQKVVVK